MESLRDLTKLTFIQTRGSACESEYYIPELDTSIRFWIITGGTPAISYSDYSYSERFPRVDRYADNNWYGYDPSARRSRYVHQDHKAMPYPSLAEDLPEGENSAIAWVVETWPRRMLRLERYNALPYTFLSSKRIHDKDNHIYAWASIDLKLTHKGVSPVTVNSELYAGRANEVVDKFGSQAWKNLQDFINPIFDANMRVNLEDLTEDQFATYCDLLRAAATESSIKIPYGAI